MNILEREGLRDPKKARKFFKDHVFKIEKHGSEKLCEIFAVADKKELFDFIDDLYPNGTEAQETKHQIGLNDKAVKRKQKRALRTKTREAKQREEQTEMKTPEAAQSEEQTEKETPEAAQSEEQTEKEVPEAARSEEQTEKEVPEAVQSEEQDEKEVPEAAQSEEQTEKEVPEAPQSEERTETESCVEQLLEEIRETESAIKIADSEIAACEKKLVETSEEVSEIRRIAIKLQAEIDMYLRKVQILMDSCNELQVEMEEKTSRKTVLTDKLENLREEVQKRQALYYTLEESCVTERCKLASEEVSVSVPEVCEQIGWMMNPNNEEISDVFRDCAQVCAVQELMQIAEVYLYAVKLKELHKDRELNWQFSCKSNVSEMMTYAGFKVVVAI